MRLSVVVLLLYVFASSALASGPLCSDLFHEEAPDSPTGVTQTQLVREGLLQYPLKLFSNLRENLAHLTGNSDYAQFEKLHVEDPQGSVFRIFEKNSYRNKPTKKWSFPFYNRPEFFTDILKHEFGFCSGITTSLRKFNMLAEFQLIMTDPIPDRTQQPKEWMDYYADKIERLMNNEMTTIQGFEDLFSFATDPEIQKYIREKIVDQWQVNNVNLLQGTLDGFLSVRQSMDQADLMALNQELSKKLSYGYNPIVYLSSRTKRFFSTRQWIHVVMVTEVSELQPDGSYSIKIWDINRDAKSATRTIKIAADGKMVMGEKNINMIKLLRWDDLDIERMIKKNANHCIVDTCTKEEE